MNLITISSFERVAYFVFLVVFCGAASASDVDHDALRALKDKMIVAINTTNYEKLSASVHKNVVITIENGKVLRGRDQLIKFYQDILNSKHSPLVSFKINAVDVAELSMLYLDAKMAIAYGTVDSSYNLRNGGTYNMVGHWSATLVKENNQWMLAGFQNTVNLMDNPILDQIKKRIIFVALTAFIAGIVIVLFLSWLRKKQASK